MNAKRIAMLLSCVLAFGCASSTGTEPQPSSSATLAIVEHSAGELSALDRDQPLAIDLRSGLTVHIVEFAHVRDLLNVELITDQGTFVLGELAEELAEDSHRLVLGATDAELDLYFADHPRSAEVISEANPLGHAGQARIKLRDCDGCVDPTGIGPVICSDDSPCRGTP